MNERMNETVIKSEGKVYIASDKENYALKNQLKTYLESLSYFVIDLGAFEIEETVDYPVLGREVAEKVAENDDAEDEYANRVFGVLINGNGIGMLTAASEIKGAKSVFVKNSEDVDKAKKSGAKIVCVATDITPLAQVKELIHLFIIREN